METSVGDPIVAVTLYARVSTCAERLLLVVRLVEMARWCWPPLERLIAAAEAWQRGVVDEADWWFCLVREL